MKSCPICNSPHFFSKDFKIFQCLTCKTLYNDKKEVLENKVVPLLEENYHEFNK